MPTNSATTAAMAKASKVVLLELDSVEDVVAVLAALFTVVVAWVLAGAVVVAGAWAFGAPVVAFGVVVGEAS